ncbi:MAG TPA: hypothetical protein VFM36_11880 [Thermoanaerobaculia bacterium]|nr:hypothetical protein [Thermoanaerobaculia bacterium]
MKKVLVVLGVLVLMMATAVWVASWFWAGDVVSAAVARPWPYDLGPLDKVPDRYPLQQESEGARKLTRLAEPLVESDAVANYVRQEIARGDLTIGEPPEMADLTAIRDLLLREPVVWARGIGRQHGGLLPRVAMHRSLTRALIGSALARARRDDAGAWDDLRAAWNLTKSLHGHPHLTLRLMEMSMTRSINAVAWKMPLPVPAWFEEVQKRDFVRPLTETLQVEKWWEWHHQKFPLKPFAEAVERERIFTGELVRVTECEFQRESRTPAVDIGWQRAFRYRAEREATANALRARAGQPIDERSQCSDGAWQFDGTTLSFPKPIALPERRDTSMPLTIRISPDPEQGV